MVREDSNGATISVLKSFTQNIPVILHTTVD